MISGLVERMSAPQWWRVTQFDALFAILAGGVLVAHEAEKRLGVADRLAACLINQQQRSGHTDIVRLGSKFMIIIISFVGRSSVVRRNDRPPMK